jgi:hypothetical protein
LIYSVNIDFFKQRYGLPQEYQPGMPLPKMSYEITQKITDDLRDLKVRMGQDVATMAIATNGRATIPTDYIHFSSARYNQITDNTCGNLATRPRAIEHLSDAQIGDRLGDSIKMPTLKNPVFVTYAGYFQFYPKTVSNVEFTYLRMPKTPVYGYVADNTTDDDTYDETTSVHFEYPEDCFNDIVSMCLGYIGINLRSSELLQYAEMQKEKGV